MKRFRSALLPAIVIPALFLSCKKNTYTETQSDFYLKFKLNGKWVTWTKVLGELAPYLADESKTDLSVTGQSDDNKAVLDISVQVDGEAINAGSYSSDDYRLPIIYAKGGGDNTDSYTLGSVDGRDRSRYIVTITSITENTITGTFTGNYLESEFQENTSVEITEGQFKVHRLR
ncbi:MAG: hypothetical protein JNK79_06440 [Chitinophagaceae bacterium]|nr:hypothetical protein [Chitinophagaceae bacterium]